jgi:hypothetical protein
MTDLGRLRGAAAWASQRSRLASDHAPSAPARTNSRRLITVAKPVSLTVERETYADLPGAAVAKVPTLVAVKYKRAERGQSR